MLNDVVCDDFLYIGVFYILYLYFNKVENDMGVLMVWVWGVLKILDVFEKGVILEIDVKKVIVIGFLRYGKVVLVVGVFDERFVVVNLYVLG